MQVRWSATPELLHEGPAQHMTVALQPGGSRDLVQEVLCRAGLVGDAGDQVQLAVPCLGGEQPRQDGQVQVGVV